MTSLTDIQKEAREKWGIEVGPNSTQRGQEDVLCELIALAYQAGRDAAIAYVEKVGNGEYRFDRKTGYHVSLQMLDQARLPD